MTHISPDLLMRMKNARRCVVLSGSGISAESGVPTFRDARTGLWRNYRAEDLATAEAFQHDPKLVWRWYQWRREIIGRAAPNPGHTAIVDLEYLLPDVIVVTQNVDGLHQRAGSRRVIEFHGNIHRNICTAERRVIEIDVTGTESPPSCPDCGASLRPDVVWFGEPIPPLALQAANSPVQVCDKLNAIGTSAQVQPAADLAHAAKRAGATLVELNPNPTPMTDIADFVLSGPAGIILPQLVAQLRSVQATQVAV
jgi:NAD-dependent deacetylase